MGVNEPQIQTSRLNRRTENEVKDAMAPSRTLISLGFLFLFALGVAGPAKAVPPYKPASAEPKRSKVVYNEASDSYFQYILYPVGKEQNWFTVRKQAERMTYNGLQGRLAVVPDQNVSDFLRRTFKPKTYVWIGLRYFCRYRKLMWVTDKILGRESFQRWAGQWYRNREVTCSTAGGDQIGGMTYMPVYYTSTQQGFRWQASGWNKAFYGYFVEYPKEPE